MHQPHLQMVRYMHFIHEVKRLLFEMLMVYHVDNGIMKFMCLENIKLTFSIEVMANFESVRV